MTKHLENLQRVAYAAHLAYKTEAKRLGINVTTLLEIVKDTVEQGRSIRFVRDVQLLQIDISKVVLDKRHGITQVMPLQDHFTEEKLIGCIDFMNEHMDQLEKIKKCDLCGKDFAGKKFDVLDEQYNLQPGLISCKACSVNQH